MKKLSKQLKTVSSSQTWILSQSFFFLLFLHLLRHRLGAANQIGILSTASGVEMADVKQMKKIVLFITCEIAFGQSVGELMFGVDVSDLNLGI